MGLPWGLVWVGFLWQLPLGAFVCFLLLLLLGLGYMSLMFRLVVSRAWLSIYLSASSGFLSYPLSCYLSVLVPRICCQVSVAFR